MRMDRRIDELSYQVVIEEDTYHLCNIVSEYMEEGWKPTGGMSMVTDNEGLVRFGQAMVRTPCKKVFSQKENDK